MSTLSEVSLLIGQRAGDLDKAREIFTAEARAFVAGILGGVRRARSDPWTAARVRLDLPREIECEQRTAGYLSGQYAYARTGVRFKRGTNFVVVADLRFGIEHDDASAGFAWQVTLVPGSRYQRMDDLLWQLWRGSPRPGAPPGVEHIGRSNTIRFAFRSLDSALTPELAFSDVKTVLEFLMIADVALAEAVGLDTTQADEEAG